MWQLRRPSGAQNYVLWKKAPDSPAVLSVAKRKGSNATWLLGICQKVESLKGTVIPAM
jgi:hypothetical protein